MQVASSRPARTECYSPPGRNILGLPVPHQSERSFSAAARARSRVGPGSRSSWRAYTCEKPWFIARWHSPISWTVLCFGLNPEMKHRFSRALVDDNSPFDASSALSLQASIVGHIVDEFDRAVWSWRHPVRAIETRRESTHSPPDSYESMHELARHTIHSSEMLRTAIVVVESMLEESGPRSPSSDSITATVSRSRKRRGILSSTCQGCEACFTALKRWRRGCKTRSTWFVRGYRCTKCKDGG